MEGASVLPSSKTKHWTSLLWGDRRQLQNESETRHLTEKAHHDTNILCRRIGLVHLQNNTHSVGDPTRQELDFFDAGGGHTPFQQCWRTYRDGFCPMSAYCRFNHMNIKIAYDSTYAASCTQGIWAPNQAAQHWLCLCQTTSYVSFRYVAAHTSLQDWGSINNEAADAAVKSHKFKIGCVQAFNTHLRYHPYLTLPGGNCQDFARTSFNSAFRRTAEPSFQQTSTQQHDNRRTVFKQHQEHFHSKRGTAEEQDAYNKVKTYKDHSNNGPDDSGHRDLYVHNWTRKCGYKMQVASNELLKKLGVNIQGKTHTGQDPFRLEETTQFGEQAGDGNYEPPVHMHQLLPPWVPQSWKHSRAPADFPHGLPPTPSLGDFPSATRTGMEAFSARSGILHPLPGNCRDHDLAPYAIQTKGGNGATYAN